MGDYLAEQRMILEAEKRKELIYGQVVYLVWRTDDESTHVFSDLKIAEEYANSLDCNVVISEYVIDCPQRYYGDMQ